MKEIKKYKDVKFLGLYNGEMALWYPNRLEVGNKVFPTKEGDDYVIWTHSKYLEREREKKRMILVGDKFIDLPQGRYGYSNRMNNYLYSEKKSDNVYSISIFQEGKEYLVNLDFITHKSLCSAFEDSAKNVLIISDSIFDCHSLLAFTKTGQRLWEYKEEDENLKINGRCIPVVDDVVVVISQDCGVPGKIQGFNIHSGEKLWEIPDAEDICPNTFFIGEDKMLYGCYTEQIDYDEESRLMLTIINPINGEIENVEAGKACRVMGWLVTMHGRQLYYTDNRRGNEIGVIDVDKRELIERVPLNIKKKVTIGAPVVTDDKVYVFISDLQELRVFEK